MDDQSETKTGPNLIFMAGLTGSGKSGLKEVLLEELTKIDPERIDPKIMVSVDDIFENDDESIAIFHKLYSFHFGESCNNINKLSEEIRITRYLSRLFGMESFRTITSKCVLNQIHRRYCPGKKLQFPFLNLRRLFILHFVKKDLIMNMMKVYKHM